MSSGLPFIPNAARTVVKAMAPQLMRRVELLGMTPRQQELNRLWAYYTTNQYDYRKVDWDGSERVDHIDATAIATAGVLPGGFYDAGNDFPLKFRRPTSPYHLGRVVVNRFTGLLFSESQHPKIRCVGDQDLEDYVNTLADVGRLWAAMILARTFGGATGTACVGFKFVEGEIRFEVHDPRWVTPIFKDLETRELESIDKRYMYPEYVLNEKQEWDQEWYWYRRLIDSEIDVVWNKVPVGEGDEPDWVKFKPDQAITHDYGFCPVRWVQNKPVQDADDGEPDCLGAFDMIEEMDALVAQATFGTKHNCDPTVLITSDLKLAEIRKGSDNAIKLEKGGTASYMEMSGSGPKTAVEQALILRGWILEMTQCVLDHPDTANRTAYEIRMVYASMTSNADILREQYGQKLILPLIKDVIKAIRLLKETSTEGPNGPIKQAVILPPKEVKDENGETQFVDRELPETSQRGVFQLQWPQYFPPTLLDASQAADAAGKAKTAGLIDDEGAIRFIASYFGIEDVPAALLKVKAEAQERDKQAQARAAQSFGGFGGQG